MSIIAVMDASTVQVSDGTRFAAPDGPVTICVLAAKARARGIQQLWIHGWPHVVDTLLTGDWDGTVTDPAWCHVFERGVYGAVAIVQPSLDCDLLKSGESSWHSDWHTAADAATLLRALILHEQLIGVPYARSAGAVGTKLVRTLHAGPSATRLDAPGTLPDELRRTGDRPLVWKRPLTPDESVKGYLHAYDVNGQYLAACSALALGMGEPERVQMIALDEAMALPGVFRVRLTGESLHALIPVPWERTQDGFVRCTTPMLQLYWQFGFEPVIVDGWLWREHHRVLEPWYKRLRQARQQLMETPDDPGAMLALRSVKRTYTRTLGRMATDKWDREGDTLYRPDWYWLVIGQARANIYRRVVRMAAEGAYPFAVGADCVYLASDDPDPTHACPAALPLGDGLGQFKVKDSVRLAEAMPHMETLTTLQSWLNRERLGVRV